MRFLDVRAFGAAAAVSLVSSVHGQGLVQFSNAGQQVNAPFFDSTGALLSGTNYLVQMYAGATPDELFAFAAPAPFLSGAYAGYFTGPDVELPPTIVSGGCGPVWVQLRTWRASGGGTFEQAALAGEWSGVSTVIYLPYTGGSCGGVPFAPPPLRGLQYPGTPLIVQQPPDRSVIPTETTDIWVVASGGVALSYQWYRGLSGETYATIAGATNALYEVPWQGTNSTFWVRVSSSAGSVDSRSVNVWVVSYNATLSLGVSSGLPDLTINSTLNTTVQVQYNPDLNPARWSVLTNIWQAQNPFTFTDFSAANNPTRFYRLTLP